MTTVLAVFRFAATARLESLRLRNVGERWVHRPAAGRCRNSMGEQLPDYHQNFVRHAVQERLRALNGVRKTDLERTVTDTFGHVRWLRDAKGDQRGAWLVMTLSVGREVERFPRLMLSFFELEHAGADQDPVCVGSAMGSLSLLSEDQFRFEREKRGFYIGRHEVPSVIEVSHA